MINKPKCLQNYLTNETGLSGFHKMTTTVLKTHFKLKTYFKKQNPKLIIYRKYKNFDNLLFREEFLSKFKDLLANDKNLKGFQEYCLLILNSLAPLKTKYFLANEAFFIN